MSDIVIREVTKNVWIFSRPFARFGLIPFGGRSTAIKLNSGDVWVVASTPLTSETKLKLDELGPVKYIMAADSVHYLFLREFKTAYPQAKLIGVEPLFSSDKLQGLKFDGAYGIDSPDTKYGFETEISACYFTGFKNKDVVFYHHESKSIMEADLLFNLPGKETYSRSNKSGKFPFIGYLSPGTWIHRQMVWSVGVDKAAMKRDARTVAQWDFTRIIPCHGDVIEDKAADAWRSTYHDFLDYNG